MKTNALTLSGDRIVNFDGSSAPLNALQLDALLKGCVCYACKQSHFTNPNVGYIWKAVPAQNTFHPGCWLILEMTECGRRVNTEPVASCEGKYHDGEANAKQICEDHNRWIEQRITAFRKFLDQPSQNLTSDQIVARLKLLHSRERKEDQAPKDN